MSPDRPVRRPPFAALILAAALVLSASAVARAAEKRVALVVGNGAYVAVGALPNAVSDARLMAGSLKGLGFRLVGGGAMVDLDKPAFDRAVEQFAHELIGADVGLFYYAGHGVQVGGENYLVPTSANPTRQADVDFQMVDAQLVLRQMGAAGTRLNVMVLDACRNNPFGGRGLRATGGGLAQMQAPEGTLISFATQPGNVAADGADGHSPYTRALVAAMAEAGQGIFDVFNHVGLRVKSVTNGEQQPWLSSSPIEGQFFFAPPAAPPVPATEAADAEIVFWQSIAASTNPDEFAAYLTRYPNGRFADLARLRLAQLQPGAAGSGEAKRLPPPGKPTVAKAAPKPPGAGATAPVQTAEITAAAKAMPRASDDPSQKAAKCVVPRILFSRTSVNSFTPVTLAASADGWCWAEPTNARGTGLSGEIRLPPSHGEVRVVEGDKGGNRYAYRPAPGYVGPDHFQFVIYPLGLMMDVTVDVQPAS